MRDTNATGAKTEGYVLSALLRAGKTVLIPFGVQGYDLVFEDGSGFHRVQCKTAYMRSGAMRFDAYSRTGNARKVVTRYDGRTDFFGVYLPYNGCCYLIPIEDITGDQGWFRVDPARNRQSVGVRMAEPYLIPSL